MNIKLFLTVIRFHTRLILLTILITILTAAILTSTQKNRYKATTSLVLSFEDDNPFEAAGVPARLSSNFIATQLDIIRSRKVALKVIELLKMNEEQQAILNYKKMAGRNISITDWLSSPLMANLTVEPLRDSRVVNISYRAFNPNRSAKIANAFAQAYIETTLELNMEPARRNAEWFDNQLKVLRKRLDEANARLTTFQQEKGIVALDERLGTENGRLNDISKGLVKAQDTTYDVKSRQLGKNHPEYRRAIERERSLSNSLKNQKKRILELKNQRDELDALAREVEAEQQSYEATLKNYYETRMKSQFNQTNISVLSPAIPPQ
ncbi:MAG: hypothetical protein GY886_06710, partial [Gammaproteobacteria bacterium]|nr:hypothetical protein [Gammaproteobacteria bacterium]